MISLHFNGDIVRHPNHKADATRRKEVADAERRCKYDCKETNCPVWVEYVKNRKQVKVFSAFGRCHLSQSEKCPQFRLRKKAGETLKTFSITARHYRNISSSAHWLLKTNVTKAVFFTLTFPPTIKKHSLTKSFYLNEISNYYFSRFIENLKQTYNCTGYIAVKENGGKNDRCHYHVLACFPYIDFMVINNAWCHCIKDICEYSNHALQTDKKTSSIIKNPVRAIRYVCKYFSKAKRQSGRSYTRLIFVSHNLIGKVAKIYNIAPQEVLTDHKGIYIQSFDYCTIFRVTDKVSFEKLCENLIYEIFAPDIKQEITENTQKNTEFTQKFTEIGKADFNK